LFKVVFKHHKPYHFQCDLSISSRLH
jgi:hypothetical protein